MPGRVTKIDRTIRHIRVPIPPLRIGQVRNHRIRLHKAVDIRRNRQFRKDEQFGKVQTRRVCSTVKNENR